MKIPKEPLEISEVVEEVFTEVSAEFLRAYPSITWLYEPIPTLTVFAHGGMTINFNWIPREEVLLVGRELSVFISDYRNIPNGFGMSIEGRREEGELKKLVLRELIVGTYPISPEQRESLKDTIRTVHNAAMGVNPG